VSWPTIELCHSAVVLFHSHDTGYDTHPQVSECGAHPSCTPSVRRISSLTSSLEELVVAVSTYAAALPPVFHKTFTALLDAFCAPAHQAAGCPSGRANKDIMIRPHSLLMAQLVLRDINPWLTSTYAVGGNAIRKSNTLLMTKFLQNLVNVKVGAKGAGMSVGRASRGSCNLYLCMHRN
jgi:hypothetical protein